MKKIKNLSKASDDFLLGEFMYWIRVGRNENGLQGDEKTYLKNLSEEIKKRKLLNVCK